jgi:L-rhamnose mutarotase
MKLLTLTLFAFLIASCNPCRYVARHQECFLPDTVKETTVQTIHDSVIFIKPDSGYIIAYFKCDSLNQVVMTELNEVKSKGVQTVTVFKDNTFKFKWQSDSIKVLNRIISNLSTHSEHIMNPVNAVLKKENDSLKSKLIRKNTYIKILGGLSLSLLIAIGLYLYFKLK